MNTAQYDTLLRERFQELSARLNIVEEALDAPMNPDFEDRAVERESDEVLERLGTAGLKEMTQIRSALARIENGQFGICVACGEEISPARLDAVPFALRCRRCA